MRRFTGRLGVLAIVMAGTVWHAPEPAVAIDQGQGEPGYCTTDQGVTVVIDFGELGGKPLVRCNPRSTRGTGLDALKGAGFQISGVQRWGESFICRIENRPSAVEALPITGNKGYQERCVDTPPATGYWSYWHAGNNCAWKYSQLGVKNRDFEAGGFEGWAFALNATADSAPAPTVSAVRPGTAGQECRAADEPAPSPIDENSIDENTADENSADRGLPAPKPRPVTTEFSGGEDIPDVSQAIEEQSGASDYAPWVAGGVVALLGAVMWLTARRRTQARNA